MTRSEALFLFFISFLTVKSYRIRWKKLQLFLTYVLFESIWKFWFAVHFNIKHESRSRSSLKSFSGTVFRIRDVLSRIRPFSHPGSRSKHFFILDPGSKLAYLMQTYFFLASYAFRSKVLVLVLVIVKKIRDPGKFNPGSATLIRNTGRITIIQLATLIKIHTSNS
jgi:hypothetical protein